MFAVPFFVSMPSRAYASLLQLESEEYRHKFQVVSMPSRAYASLLLHSEVTSFVTKYAGVNALTGLCLIVTVYMGYEFNPYYFEVSMPSRACASLLPSKSSMVRERITCVNALTGLCLIVTGI